MRLANGKTLTIFAGGMLLIAVGTTLARSSDFEEQRFQSRSNRVPLERVMTNVAAQHRGHVVKHELERTRMGDIYEIKTVDPQGIVWEMVFNAQTGKLLKLEPSDDEAQRYYDRSYDDDESNDHGSAREDEQSGKQFARRHY